MELIIYLFTLFLLLVFFVGIYLLLFQTVFGIPYVPSSSQKLARLLNDLDITPQKYPKFLDLGSGDGRIVVMAASRGHDATGYEINPYLVGFSRLLNLISKSTAKFRLGDLHKIPLGEYDVIYAYLGTKAMAKIESKLEDPNNRPKILITNTFTLKQFQPTKKIGDQYTIYEF